MRQIFIGYLVLTPYSKYNQKFIKFFNFYLHIHMHNCVAVILKKCLLVTEIIKS